MRFPSNKMHLIGRKPRAPGPLEFSSVRIKVSLKLPFKPNFQEKLALRGKKNCSRLKLQWKTNYLLWYILLITFFFFSFAKLILKYTNLITAIWFQITIFN